MFAACGITALHQRWELHLHSSHLSPPSYPLPHKNRFFSHLTPYIDKFMLIIYFPIYFFLLLFIHHLPTASRHTHEGTAAVLFPSLLSTLLLPSSACSIPPQPPVDVTCRGFSPQAILILHYYYYLYYYHYQHYYYSSSNTDLVTSCVLKNSNSHKASQ